jgi:hypothetical protein
MCLIVRGQVADLLALDLEQAQRSNSDGWGVHTCRSVYYSFGRIDDSIVNFLETRRPETVATIHFRWATHGDVNIMNAHPFHLGEQTYLMHNGVLHGEHFQHKKKSDTMRLAEILTDAGPIARAYILDDLAETAYYSNKFCLLKGKTWQMFGDWHHDKATDTWHSNRSLLGWGVSHIPTAKSGGQTFVWDPMSKKLVPRTPAASITHGRMYNQDFDDEIDGLTEREVNRMIEDYQLTKEVEEMEDAEMRYINVNDDETDTDVIVDVPADVNDPFYVGQDA